MVDVIIPTRNRYALTLEALGSVRSQTFDAWRAIVVDDASDDGSLGRLRDVALDDPRIELIERRECGGQQAARQTGFDASSAPFIATLDSDDLWEPTKLEKQIALFSSASDLPDLGAVLCWHCWVGADGTVSPRMPRVRGRASPLVSDNMSTILMRRDALEAAGGFAPAGRAPVRVSANIEFYIRLTQRCEFAVVEEVLVRCRDHAGPRASDAFGTRFAAEQLEETLELHATFLARYPKERALLRARAGARYLDAGDRSRGSALLAASLRGAGVRSALHIARRYGPFTAKRLLIGARHR